MQNKYAENAPSYPDRIGRSDMQKCGISDGGIRTFCADPIQGPAVQNRRPLRKPDFTVPAGDNSGGYGDRRCAKYHYTIGRMT